MGRYILAIFICSLIVLVYLIFIKEVLGFHGSGGFLPVFILLTILYYVWRSIIQPFKDKKFIDSYRSSKKEEEELEKSGNYWVCKSCNVKIENQFSECWSCTDK